MTGHLRLVHPAPPRAPKPRRAPLFTPEEDARLRAALKNARPLFGTWACLADAMYLHPKYLRAVAGGKPFCGSLAVRLARILGKTVESLYRPPTDAGKCPHCGAVKGRP